MIIKDAEDRKSYMAGELWEEFKKTEWYDNLIEFANKNIREMRDSIIQAAIDRDYELSRDLGQKLAGFKMFLDHIDSSISTKAEVVESELERREFEKQLPYRL